MLCRACCREKTFREHLNCRSHRFRCDKKLDTSAIRELEVDFHKDTAENENMIEECCGSETVK